MSGHRRRGPTPLPGRSWAAFRTAAGALLSRLVGGPVLLIVSGLVLIVVGLRAILPTDEAALEKDAERRHHRVLLVANHGPGRGVAR